MQIKKKGQGGFTLIELLVVVVIIGILSSVAVPNFMGAQDNAKNSGVQSNVHNVQMALEQYAVDNAGSYPAGTAFITALSSDYLPASGLPRTPWNHQQTAAITTVASGSINGFIGAGNGAGAVPTANTHYGAIAYNIASSATANERYQMSGTGKKGSRPILSVYVQNF